MDETEFLDQLRRRCPVDQLDVSSWSKYVNLQSELETISEINGYYVRQTLDRIIKIDPNCDEDWVYEMYTGLLRCGRPGSMDEDIIEYKFDPSHVIKIWERPRLISGHSTTGFRTWEAAVYLCLYILRNVDVVGGSGENVLELGAGTGMVSMLLRKIRDAESRIFITDGDSELISGGLPKNLILNGIKPNETDGVFLQRLIWGEDHVPEDIDICVGADITYDSSSFPYLCRCIDDLLSNTRCGKMIISCTVRNETTLQEFHRQCADHGLQMELISCDDPLIMKQMNKMLCKQILTPIHIYRIYK